MVSFPYGSCIPKYEGMPVLKTSRIKKYKFEIGVLFSKTRVLTSRICNLYLPHMQLCAQPLSTPWYTRDDPYSSFRLISMVSLHSLHDSWVYTDLL